jgi:hypothetical protein
MTHIWFQTYFLCDSYIIFLFTKKLHMLSPLGKNMLPSSFTRSHWYLIDKYHDCIKSCIKLGCTTDVVNLPSDTSKQIILYLIFLLLIAIYSAFRIQTKLILIWAIHKVQFTEEPIVDKSNWRIQLPMLHFIYLFVLMATYFAFMNQTKEILL